MSFTHTFEFKLAAAPPAVWSALTDAAQLRAWFAEQVEVDPRVGGPYRFWGKRTLGAPGADEATQRITALSPNATLAFDWRIHGVDTTVTLLVTPADEGTTLDLVHEVRGELPVTRQREYIDDHWRLQFGNLASHLAGGDGVVHPDFTDTQPEVRITVTVDALRSATWQALIDPALASQWLGAPDIRITPEPGGEYRVNWKYQMDGRDVVGGATRILDLIPEERLVLDWPDWRGDASVTGQWIGFTLTAEGTKTRVDFVHGGFTRTADVSDYPYGWGWFLGEFRKVATRPRSTGPAST